MNLPIQGTCADILKYAMVQIDKQLSEEKLKAKLIMQVHDELVIESPDEEISTVSAILKECMEKVVSWDIPMSVEIGVGKNWKEAKK